MIDQSFTYTPSVSGTFNQISFSIDIKTDDPFTTVFFDVSDTNGGSSGGFTSITPNGDWQTVSVMNLDISDFGSRDFGGSLPLSLGFGFLSDIFLIDDSPTSYAPEEFVMQADNFVVSISSNVPEPSTTLLDYITLISASMVRRR